MTTETPDDITERLRMESRLSRNGGVLFLPVLLDKAADEIKTLRAQVAQYKEDAERLQWLHSQVDCHAFGYWLPAICVSNDAREPEPTIDDTRAAIDKARKS